MEDTDSKGQLKKGRDQYNVEIGKEGASPSIPVIQGQFTNWHPVQMIPIEKFCFDIDKTHNLLDRMKVEEKCRRTIQSID